MTHGTYAGFMRHYRRKETPCEPCRQARNTYMARYRESHPDAYDYDKRMTNARSRALWRLAKQYPQEFRKFFDEERKADA